MTRAAVSDEAASVAAAIIKAATPELIDAVAEVIANGEAGKQLAEIHVRAALNLGDVVRAEDIDDGSSEIARLKAQLSAVTAEFEADGDRLYDAIVEGRRDDAIAMLAAMTGDYLRPVAAQRNLFPERIP